MSRKLPVVSREHPKTWCGWLFHHKLLAVADVDALGRGLFHLHAAESVGGMAGGLVGRLHVADARGRK